MIDRNDKLLKECYKIYDDYLDWMPQSDWDLLPENWPDNYRKSRNQFLKDSIFVNAEFNPNEYRLFRKDEYNQILNESSYPQTQNTEKVIDIISGAIMAKRSCFVAWYRDGVPNIAQRIIFNVPIGAGIDTEYIEAVDKIFYKYGYFRMGRPTQRTDRTCERTVLQYEPYHYNKREYLPDYLYHMTSIEHIDNIRKVGFKASNKALQILYPPRNYFFINKNIKFMSAIMYNNGRADITLKGSNPVAVFTISTRLAKNCVFYSDPYYKEHCAVYTYEDVLSKAITKVETINI